ncbi:MAG TPA: phage major capsid protein [Actinomycetota bacterium]|nr:phage major capsid protein [Actinomycetota bacterium]
MTNDQLSRTFAEVRQVARERSTLASEWGSNLSQGRMQRLEDLSRRVGNLLRDVGTRDLRDMRARVLIEIDDILDTAEQDGQRDLTPEEKVHHDWLAWLERAMTAELESRPENAALEGLARRTQDRLRGSATGRSGTHPAPGPDDLVIVERSEKLADRLRGRFPADPEELSLGRAIRAMITGDWSRAPREAEVFRDQSIAPASAGGFLVPEALSTQVIDLARAQARVFEAGAQTVVMDAGTLHMGRVAADPTAEWHKEGAQIAGSSGAYERITFVAKTLVVLVKGITVELAEDAEDFEGLVERQLAASLALELDRAALRGSGVDPEPRGIRNHDEVPVQPLTGPPVDWDFLSVAAETIMEANGTPGAVIYAPRTAGQLDRLKDTTLQPLQPPPLVASLRRLVTSQVPTNLGAGGDESEAYVGDFGQLLVGMRTELQVEATRVGGAADGGAFERMQIWVRAYLRADVQLARPNHFVVISEIQPS